MERCDDSYGLIGELAQEALLTYARLPFAPGGIAAEDWCEDLCELLAWEDWGLLHRHETKPFAQIHGPLADHAQHFLIALADELRSHRLRHQATRRWRTSPPCTSPPAASRVSPQPPPGLQRDYLHARCTELTGTPRTATPS